MNTIQITNKKGKVIYSTNDYNDATINLKAIADEEEKKRGITKVQIEYRKKYIDNSDTTKIYQAGIYTYKNNKMVEQYTISQIVS